MATYTYKEVTNALMACGFEEQKNNHGSHQEFLNPKTGFSVPVPKHSNGMVATGTAESILTYAVMQARLSNINIASNKYKLSQNVIEFIKKQHIKIKEDIRFLIPPMVRVHNKLETKEDVLNFIKEKSKIIKNEYNKKQRQQDELQK